MNLFSFSVPSVLSLFVSSVLILGFSFNLQHSPVNLFLAALHV